MNININFIRYGNAYGNLSKCMVVLASGALSVYEQMKNYYNADGDYVALYDATLGRDGITIAEGECLRRFCGTTGHEWVKGAEQ